MIDRGDYWQCAYVIPKGAAERSRPRASTRSAPPSSRSRRRCATACRSCEAGTTSSCSPSRSTGCAQWHRPGLLCIGDAAHAMSPIGGVGINLAMQDAVAAANRLAAPLRAGTVSDDDLAAVQRRRMFPTRVTQRIQVFIQNNVLSRVLASRDDADAAVAGAAARAVARCCSAFRRAWSASAFGPSMCWSSRQRAGAELDARSCAFQPMDHVVPAICAGRPLAGDLPPGGSRVRRSRWRTLPDDD